VLADSGVPHASVYMLEVDEDSRLGREMLAGGSRYHAGLVPSDDAIAQMYDRRPSSGWASRRAGAVRDFQLLPAGMNRATICATGSGGLTWGWGWMPRPCCGSSGGRTWLRAALDDDRRSEGVSRGPEPVETAWLSPAQQHEEAWFLGLRLNAGRRSGCAPAGVWPAMVAPALEVVSAAGRGTGLLDFRRQDGSADRAGAAALERRLSGVSGAGSPVVQDFAHSFLSFSVRRGRAIFGKLPRLG
jgi:oxygen-independent coproporphyrinogen-3 oxidase